MIGQMYLKHLWLSVSTPRYYLRVLRESLSQSLLFLAISCVWLGLLNGSFFYFRLLPQWRTDTTASLNELQTNFPADLDLKWDLIRFQVQPAELVPVSYPSVIQAENSGLPSKLAYISPTEITPDQFMTLPTTSLAVVTPTKLYVNDQSSWNQVPLSQAPGFDQPFTLNQQTLPTYIANWQQELTAVLDLAGTVSFIVAPFWLFLTTLLTAVFNSILLYFLLRLSGVLLKFSTVVKLSAHVVVACLIVEQIQQWLYPSLGLPLFSLCYWAFMVVIVFVIRRQAEINQLQQAVRK